MVKFAMIALGAGLLLVSPAMAQQQPAPAVTDSTGPSAVDCGKTWNSSMRWNEADFKSACAKINTNSDPAKKSAN